MSVHSKIEWTDTTWNPVTGCDRVSEGCGLPRFEGDQTGGCYAEAFAERFRGTPGHHFERGFDLTLRPATLTLPLHWRKPRRIFVNSMSDLFHAGVPDEYIATVFAVMAATPQHTYQVLTKRHARMRALLGDARFVDLVADQVTEQGRPALAQWPLPHVWMGVSVESQRWADIRVPELLGTPAAVRFLSCEPLLGPLDLSRWLGLERYDSFGWGHEMLAALAGRVGPAAGLHWVIAGGESGPDARPMDPAWVRELRDQCDAADVPFFFKQWGAWQPTGEIGIGLFRHPERLVGGPVDDMGHRVIMRRVGEGRAGRELDGRTHDALPQVVTAS
jgi:protein gp37